MTCEEFSNEFDLFYNNIMSNQAPGLNEYEKSVFLTKAQDEIVKKYFTLKGNKYNEDFDGSIKRNIDFSRLYNTFSFSTTDSSTIVDYLNILDYVDMVKFNKQIFQNVASLSSVGNVREAKKKNITCYEKSTFDNVNYTYEFYLNSTDCKQMFKGLKVPYLNFDVTLQIDYGTSSIVFSKLLETINDYSLPLYNQDTTLQINNTIIFSYSNISDLFLPIQDELTVYDEVAQQERLLQIQPLGNLEYIQKMSKPFKQPIKNQAWKIQTKANNNHNSVKLIYGYNNEFREYCLRYIKRPTPIILTALNEEGLSIRGYVGSTKNEETPVLSNSTTTPTKGLTCLLDEEIHEEILQRAVELAKAAYSGSLSDSVQLGSVSGTEIGTIQVPQQQR